MATSLLIAKLLAAVYLVVGVGILINGAHYRAVFKEMMSSAHVLYLGGVMALLVGMLITQYHNTWEANWSVIVTVIGWLSLVKGVVLLLAPKSLAPLMHFWQSRMQLAGVVTLALGLVLGYYGFVA